MIRLLFIDDHPVVSEGLATRFGAISGFEVVGVASTFRDGLGRAQAGGVDVAIVDVQLGQPLAPRQVTALAKHCAVVLFTGHATDPLVRPLLDAGARAAIDKSAPLTALDEAIRAIHAGEPAPSPPTPGPSSARALLSPREYEVYRALARCETPKEVAASLGISRSTTYCHIENVRRKLGLASLQEIVAHAFEEQG